MLSLPMLISSLLLVRRVSEVSIPFHPLGNAIWTIKQRVSGYLALQGKSHGCRGYELVGLEAGKHPWTQERFEKWFPTTKNVLLNGIYLTDEFPALYSKSTWAVSSRTPMKRSWRSTMSWFCQRQVLLRKKTWTIVYTNQDDRPNGGPYCQYGAIWCYRTACIKHSYWIVASQGRPQSSLASRDADCKLTVEDKVLKADYAWEKAFDWNMVKPAVIEFMEGNKSERKLGTALTAEA